MNYAEAKLTEIVKLPGVADLPSMVCKGAFAKALQAEDAGNLALADEQLEKACKLEAEALARG